MHALLCNLMAPALLMHALLGCCWHHEQGADTCSHTTKKTTLHTCGGHHHCHHPDESESKHRGQSGPCAWHCQGMCTYLPQQKLYLDASPILRSIGFLAISTPALHNDSLVLMHWERTRLPRAALQPLSLHLLHQVILI